MVATNLGNFCRDTTGDLCQPGHNPLINIFIIKLFHRHHNHHHLGTGRDWMEVNWLSARSSSSRFSNGERRDGENWSIEFPDDDVDDDNFPFRTETFSR